MNYSPSQKVSNQYPEKRNYNLFTTDSALLEYFEKELSNWKTDLTRIGEDFGTEYTYHQADLANKNCPELRAFDSRGNRKDMVEFHPSWHWFMAYIKKTGIISAPFENAEAGRWPYFAAGFYLMSQIEAGSMCPTTMTQGAIPLLQREPELRKELGNKIMSREYDQRDIPISEKKSIWLGMGVTEKQGGSDVRANQTEARPIEKSGRGQAYLISGHKWFYSAPMCDAHLVVARTADTDQIACFFVPRWRFNGTKNPISIQRLKDKVGNKSNASSEVEFHNAWGIMIGEEGRGIPTIIEMATYTRLATVLGSGGIIRQATVQAIAYARRRKAFGKTLIDQPLMRNVLVDFALESEATLHLGMKLAEAFEAKESDLKAMAWKRIGTPAAKYYVCKRAESLTAEAMEVLGGNGYVEEGIMARLFREAPVNSIWEGSGNIMCLDVLRAMKKEPELMKVFMEDLGSKSGGDNEILALVGDLQKLLQSDPKTLEAKARLVADKLAILMQAALMKERSPQFMSEAFTDLRIKQRSLANFGSFNPESIENDKILERCLPAS